MAIRLSALRAGRPLSLGRILVLISVKRLSVPQDHRAAGKIRYLKNPVTQRGIEPATFRLVQFNIMLVINQSSYFLGL
jgi:hypothetical protein